MFIAEQIAFNKGRADYLKYGLSLGSEPMACSGTFMTLIHTKIQNPYTDPDLSWRYMQGYVRGKEY